MERQIVVLGGGGFTMEPDNPLLEEYILSLVPKERPRICFLPTASADSTPYIVRFYRAFSARANPTDLTLFDPAFLPKQPKRTADIGRFVAEQDIVYVGGGSTANLLAMWRAHGLVEVLREAWTNGTLLVGISAGMICWFRDGITDSFGQLRPLGDGLGFLDASACPHYNDPTRRAAYREAVAGGLAGGYAADDGVALRFDGNDLVEAVSSRPEAAAYRVKLIAGSVEETRIDTRYLGA